MNDLDTSDYAALLRQDFYGFLERIFLVLNPETPFLGNSHLEQMVAKLEACRTGQCRRLIINAPPRSLKSIATSVAFVAWLLGHQPSAPIICASYGQDLADKHARDSRIVMGDDFYKSIFSGTRIAARNQSNADFATTAKGGRMATSVGGVLTGRGAAYLIINDPSKPDEAISDVRRQGVNDWFDNSLLSRLDNKRTGVIIIIMQRLHTDDLVGHVLQQGGWEGLKLPAIAVEDEVHRIWTPYGEYTHERKTGQALHPRHEPLESLDDTRRLVGEYIFAGQCQQDPVPQGGGMAKGHWFSTYLAAKLPSSKVQLIQSWDTASKANELNDFSVCTTWAVYNKYAYLVDVVRRRMDYPTLKRMVVEKAREFKPSTILIEDKASGIQLVQELKYEGLHVVRGVKPEGDKKMRLLAQTATIENGFVHLPKDSPWLLDYLAEMTSFPMAKFDDQVDSTSQALGWLASELWKPGMGLFN